MIHKILAVIFVFVLISTSFADEKIFEISDPRGDDYGDGTLIFPIRDDLKQGDLDLVSLSAKSTEGGTMFEATFARKIRVPDARAIDAGGLPQNRFFTQGFYTFNIDIYIDTDRKPASGHTETLPGRLAKISNQDAWERVVCLTPRPSDAESMMRRILRKRIEDEIRAKKGRVDPEDDAEIEGRASRDLRDQYLFPTRVRVVGQKVEFFVPAVFLGGAAKPQWGYVVAVTGAVLEYKMDLGTFLGSEKKKEPPLLNLEVTGQVPRENFGTNRREEDRFQPPLIDLVVPEGSKQSEVLRNFDVNTGKMVELRAVVPAP